MLRGCSAAVDWEPEDGVHRQPEPRGVAAVSRQRHPATEDRVDEGREGDRHRRVPHPSAQVRLADDLHHEVRDSTHTRWATQLTPGGRLNSHEAGDSTHTRWVTQRTPGGWLNSHEVGDSTHTRWVTQLTPGGWLNSHQVSDSPHTRWVTQLTPGGRLNAHQVGESPHTRWVTQLTPGGWLNSHQVGDSTHSFQWTTRRELTQV